MSRLARFVAVGVDDVPVAAGDLVDCLRPRCLAGEELPERVLPQCPADGEPVEAVHRSADPDPLDDLRLVRAAAQHDALDAAAAFRPGLRHDFLAGWPAVQSLDLPDVGLHAASLQRRDGRHDEIGPQPAVVRTLITAEPIQLRLRRRDQQLEEKLALGVAQPVTQPGQPLGLTAIQVRVTVGVVADQHLGERRVERLDVRAEIVAVLKLELLLT